MKHTIGEILICVGFGIIAYSLDRYGLPLFIAGAALMAAGDEIVEHSIRTKLEIEK